MKLDCSMCFRVLLLLFLVAQTARAVSSYYKYINDLARQRRPGSIPIAQNISIVHRLMWKLFSQYHKTTSLDKPVIVSLDVLLIKVKGTVEKEGIFESVLAVFISWKDRRLTWLEHLHPESWDPADYDNITSLSLEPDQIGVPDIAMKNSADQLYVITRHRQFTVRLIYSGEMKYVPTGIARTWCDFKLFTFPFDVQQCSLEFESWSLDHTLMTFNGRSEILLDKAFVSPLWTICNLSATTYDHTYFTNETFTRVRFDILVRRKYTFYIVNLIFPCTTLSFIQLLVFWIPSTDTTADRIGFSTTNLLTLVVFQTILTEELPKTSDAVTALSKYIIALIVTSAIGIFESVTVERMFRTFQKPPPRCLYNILRPFPLLFREVPSYEDARETQSLHQTFEEKAASPRQAFARKSVKVSVSSRPTLVPMSAEEKTRLLMSVPSVDEEDNNTENSSRSRQRTPRSSVNLGYSSFADEDTMSHLTKCRRKNYVQNCKKYFSKSGSIRETSFGHHGTADGDSSDTGNLEAAHLKRRIRRISSPYLKSASRRESCSSKKKAKSLFNNPDQTRNACLWMEVAYKIDCATFAVCLLLSVFLPSCLFVPLLFFGDNCIPSFQLDN